MFGGSFTHSLDSVGRFVMPKRFRSELGLEFIITKGLGCLCVFHKDYVSKYLEPELEGLGTPLEALLNPDIARLNRHFFSEMVTQKLDGQNRVQLTPEHRRYAQIGEEVVICGCRNFVELWSPDVLAEYQASEERVEDLVRAGAALIVPKRASGDSSVGVSPPGPA